MVLAVCKAVAVAALPVHEPEDPEVLPVIFPVTFPVKFPTKVVVVKAPVEGL